MESFGNLKIVALNIKPFKYTCPLITKKIH